MLNETIRELAGRILKQLMADQEITAWELKMELKIPNSLLYLALGFLMQAGRVELVQDGFTYRVKASSLLKPVESDLKFLTESSSDRLQSLSQEI